MTFQRPTEYYDDACNAYVAGEGVERLAQRMHMGSANLKAELQRRSLWRSTRDQQLLAARNGGASRRSPLPETQVVAEYLAGDSENVIAKRYGVQRRRVRIALTEAGVEIRDQAAANRLMVASRTLEQRQAYAKAAHDAVRGVPLTEERMRRAALSREKLGCFISPAETMLGEWLTQRDHRVVPQKAVGRYNLDLAVDGRLAVEVHGGNWHAHGGHAERAPQRARFILAEGWSLAVVWNTDYAPLSEALADVLSEMARKAWRPGVSFEPSHVILFGDGRLAPVQDLDRIALVPPRIGRGRA